MPSNILTDRDANTSLQNSPAFSCKDKATENVKPKSMDYHRQMMENKLRQQGDSAANQDYVSPSDAIMSPASQKLSSFKQRQMTKQVGAPIKSRSLFQKTVTSARDAEEQK